MSIHNKTAATPVRRALLCASLVLGAAPAAADPADYVFTPYADVGLWRSEEHTSELQSLV